MYSIHITLSSVSPVPYDHQYELYSSIQSKIKEKNPEISQKIHDNKGVPFFNMSSLIPLKFQGKPSWLNARLFSLYINTVHPDIEEIFLSVLTPGTVLILNSCMLNVLSIESKIITMDHLPLIPQFKCRGPVVIREKGKYFRVGDENFESHLISALKRKADAVVGKDTVVRGVKIINSRRKLYKVAGHNVPASILSFIVDADEDVIRTALTYGVGAKTQMGFGMVVLSE